MKWALRTEALGGGEGDGNDASELMRRYQKSMRREPH